MEVDAPLLVPIVELAGLLFAFAFIVVARRVIQAFLGTLASWLSFLPGIGGVTAGLVNSAESAISGALSSAIRGIESAIGHSWHLLSRTLGMLWAEQKLVAENLWHIAQGFYHFASLSDLQRWLHDITRLIHHTAASASGAVARELHGVERRLGTIERYAHGRIHYLEHAIDTTIPAEIGSLWGAKKALEDSIKQLWDSVRSLQGLLAPAAIAAAVAVAIDTLGLGWIKCRNSKGYGNALCGLPADIAQILIDGLALFAVGEGIIVFAEHVQGITNDVAGFAKTFWQVADGATGRDRAIGSPTVSG